MNQRIDDMADFASDERSINAKRDGKIAVTGVTDFSCRLPAGGARYRTKAT
jgi:hypothetical protein